jgi:hypothetical protein
VVNVYVVEQDSPASKLVRWCLADDGFDITTVQSSAELAELLRDEEGVVVYNVATAASEKIEDITMLKEAAAKARVVNIETPTGPELPQADVTLRMPFHADDLSIAIRMLAS